MARSPSPSGGDRSPARRTRRSGSHDRPTRRRSRSRDGGERERRRHGDDERRHYRERGEGDIDRHHHHHRDGGDRDRRDDRRPPGDDRRGRERGDGGRGDGGRGGGGGKRGRPGDGEKFEQEARYDWGKPEDAEGEEGAEKPLVVDKPNFGLTGALARDANTGNVYKGVVLKWTEPDDARKPEKGWRLYVFKDGDIKDTLHLHRQSAYLVGRHDVADLKVKHPFCSGSNMQLIRQFRLREVEHPSCSKQHAVIQFRLREVKDPEGEATGIRRVIKPYLMDLESVNKTKLNGEYIPPARYVELRAQDTIQFGLSSREYVLMHENLVEK